MVSRNHEGSFIEAKNQKRLGEILVVEAKAVGISLSWIKNMRRQEHKVIIESDS